MQWMAFEIPYTGSEMPLMAIVYHALLMKCSGWLLRYHTLVVKCQLMAFGIYCTGSEMQLISALVVILSQNLWSFN